MKKQELKVVSNSAKQNQILNLEAVHVELQKAVAGSKCKVFTDSKYYTGIGVKCNGFSVNVKKKQYTIYCNDSNYEAVEGKFADCEFTKDGNSADKTRPNVIICRSTADLLSMVGMILKANYTQAVDTN